LRRRGICVRGVASIVSALMCIASPAGAAETNFTDLSLAELMNEPVTTVSKKTTRLGDATTAITVLTADDIRRNGFTTIPEALRMVPGFDVARIDASHWAISARGFNLQYANTLLVLIDGRSVYTPSFGGVYWDAQDVTLDDIDRIEVIRGPGATLWGANAVNGVVNIITKNARDTQGVLLSGAAGTEDRPQFDARYGGTLGSDGHFRVYAKYFDRDGLYNSDDSAAFDDWNSIRTGFRSDWSLASDRLTVQGDYYKMHSQHVINEIAWTPPYVDPNWQHRESDGGNLLGRWTRHVSDTSHVSLQAYFDAYDMALESRRTADVQLEHRFAPAAGHDIVWGVGYRNSTDHLHLGADLTSDPARRRLSLYTAFMQDEISFAADRVRFTIGTKLEHNDFTGLEVQPNLRLLFAPNSHTSVWAAASRSVSTPSRFYHDTRFNVTAFEPQGSPLIVAALLPAPDLPSSKVNAYELGYRVEPMARLSVDIATFFSDYRGFYGDTAGTPIFEAQPVPHLLLPLYWNHGLTAKSYGAEAAVSWRALDNWNLSASYSWLHLRVKPVDTLGVGSPAHQANLSSRLTLLPNLEINSAVYYVGSIDSLNSTLETTHIPSYVRLDTGVIYRPSATLELGLWGQNLLDPRHGEISSQDSGTITQVPRAFLAKITKRF
jgi:iron complex outermembrane recepter protein